MITNKDGKPADCALLPMPKSKYELSDFSVGDAGRPDPLEQYSRPRLRSIIYGETERRRSG